MKSLFTAVRVFFIVFVSIFSLYAIAQNTLQKTTEEALVLPIDKTPLSFITATGQHNYAVEIAKTQQEQEKGLMFRNKLASNRAMLFVYPASSIVTMWMKNTLLSLDMVFVDGSGRVVSFAHNAVPQSEVIISSGFPVRYVVELNAGQIKKMDLKQGDCVIHAAIEAKCVR